MRRRIIQAARSLGLAHPIKLIILRERESPEGYCGLYESKKRFHKITLARFNPRGFNSVLAHELIHAYLYERFPQLTEDHGPTFQFYCEIMESKLKDITLENPLYIEGVDVG